MPRRAGKKEVGLCPWYGLWPITKGAKPEPRAQPEMMGHRYGETEPRLTSGGRAAPKGLLGQSLVEHDAGLEVKLNDIHVM